MDQMPPCFFMICTDGTEKECLDKGLFGDRAFQFDHMKAIERGHVGFLVNVSRDELIGPFEARDRAGMNIDPSVWGGGFPAQVRVKPIGEIKRISEASSKLTNILEIRLLKGHKIPAKKTYGPEITARVLALFESPQKSQNGSSKAMQMPRAPHEDRGGIAAETAPPGSEHEEQDSTPMPSRAMEKVAGLEEVKRFVYQRLIAPFENEELAYKLGIRVGGGMLLFGPPGTGKTMIAHAIAEDLEAKLIDVSPSVIMGYPGEAEKRLEHIFEELRMEPRAVLLLDEAEWILCERDTQTSSVMQRITPVLLAQIGRLFKERKKPVVVIAVTNKPKKIDPAFLRPGRFEKLFYVSLPDREARKQILKLELREGAHTLVLDDFDQIAGRLDGYSGADIAHIVEDAACRAFERGLRKGDAKIEKDDILSAIAATPKSVMEEEVREIEEWARDRNVLRQHT
ncbi:MAG: AAA family ATPase [Planctomycetota bacterium]|nr:AAA family ATPase [Planctomycetota bacterium]